VNQTLPSLHASALSKQFLGLVLCLFAFFSPTDRSVASNFPEDRHVDFTRYADVAWFLTRRGILLSYSLPSRSPRDRYAFSINLFRRPPPRSEVLSVSPFSSLGAFFFDSSAPFSGCYRIHTFWATAMLPQESPTSPVFHVLCVALYAIKSFLFFFFDRKGPLFVVCFFFFFPSIRRDSPNRTTFFPPL